MELINWILITVLKQPLRDGRWEETDSPLHHITLTIIERADQSLSM